MRIEVNLGWEDGELRGTVDLDQGGNWQSHLADVSNYAQAITEGILRAVKGEGMIHGWDIEQMMYPRTSEERQEQLAAATDYLLKER